MSVTNIPRRLSRSGPAKRQRGKGFSPSPRAANDLVDTVGGLVTAPSVTFRTRDDTPPFYDPRNLKIGFPNEQGGYPGNGSLSDENGSGRG